MKLNAVAVSTKDINKSVNFYRTLGFQFDQYKEDDQHVETIPQNSIKIMIDSEDLMEEILGEKPRPSNHSSFAIQFDSPDEVNQMVKQLEENGYNIHKAPWDAFWGQRYALVKDPGGYMVDLYAYL